MRKIGGILLSVVLGASLALTGCGDDDDPEPGEPSGNTPTTTNTTFAPSDTRPDAGATTSTGRTSTTGQ